jgi:uroporphyrinogen decarboxylase
LLSLFYDFGMNGRERLKRAIEFKGPDRVPITIRDLFPLLHLPPMSWQPEEPYYPYVHPAAIKLRLWRSKRKLPKDWLNLTREAIDEWGVIWVTSGLSALGEARHGPLEDGWELLDTFKPPDYTDWNRYKTFARLCKVFGARRYRLGINDNSIWEKFRFLRGFNNALTDLITYPDETKRLLRILTDVHLTIVDMFHQAGADGFILVDDWGTQTDSFISPKHFEQFFLEPYSEIAHRCHRYGMNCGIHSCGQIRHIVPLLIEAGMEFLQLDSPCMTGIDWLAENAGGKLSFCNSADIQTIYPRGDRAELEAHLKEQIYKLGNFNGGFSYFPYTEPKAIGVDRKTKKFCMEVVKRYGIYPLDTAALRQ